MPRRDCGKYRIDRETGDGGIFERDFWIDVDFSVRWLDTTRAQTPTIGPLLTPGYVGDNGVTLSSTISGIIFPATKTGVPDYDPAVDFSFEIPHSYELDRNFHPHFHALNMTTVASTVATLWEVNYVNYVDGSINTYSGTVGIIITPDDVLYTKYNIGFGPDYGETISDAVANSSSLSGQIQGSFRRLNDATITISDVGYSNYQGSMGFLTLGFHIPLDMAGSRQPIVK